jgi:hypothetical protein
MAQDKAVEAVSKFLNGIDVSITLANVEYYMLIIRRSLLPTSNGRTIVVIVRVATMGRSPVILRKPIPSRSQYQQG